MVTKAHLSVVPSDSAQLSNQEIVSGLIARDASATLELHTRYGDRINRLVWRMFRSSNDHNDIIHEIYVNILQKIHTLKNVDALENWIVSITLNTVRMELRSRKQRYGLGFEAKKEPAQQQANQENIRRTRSALEVLNKMTPKYQIVFVLRIVEQYSIAEIVEATGCSSATVNRQIAAAKKQFMKIASRDVILRSMIGGELDG